MRKRYYRTYRRRRAQDNPEPDDDPAHAALLGRRNRGTRRARSSHTRRLHHRSRCSAYRPLRILLRNLLRLRIATLAPRLQRRPGGLRFLYRHLRLRRGRHLLRRRLSLCLSGRLLRYRRRRTCRCLRRNRPLHRSGLLGGSQFLRVRSSRVAQWHCQKHTQADCCLLSREITNLLAHGVFPFLALAIHYAAFSAASDAAVCLCLSPVGDVITTRRWKLSTACSVVSKILNSRSTPAICRGCSASG